MLYVLCVMQESVLCPYDLVHIEHLIRVLINKFQLNYLNFGNAFKEWCTKDGIIYIKMIN